MNAFLNTAMERYGDCVYRLALCRLQNIEDAQDAYQDTFLALLNQRNPQAWEESRLKAWLLRTSVNRCTDLARRRKVRSYIALEDIPEVSAPQPKDYTDLWEAVAQLPEKQRMIFHLHYSEGYTAEEIGHIVGMLPGTVRVNLNRARKQLRKELSHEA